MANVTTETQVANLALQRIGIAIISDIDSPGTDKAALAASRIFTETRDEVMALFPWASVMTRVALSTSAAADSAFDYSHTQATPFLYVMDVTSIGGTENIDYRIEGTKIYTDQQTGYIRTIVRNATVSTWEPLLVEAIVLRLAQKLAVWLAGDMQLSATMLQEFVTLVSVAMVTKAITEHEDNEKVLAILNQQLQALLLQKPKVVE